MPSNQERVVPEVNNPEAQNSSSAAAGPARAFHDRLMHNFNDPRGAETPEFSDVSFW